jgi:hypothetical protein
MRNLALAVVLAAPLVAVVLALPVSSGHPPRCGTVTPGIGSFCVNWNPGLGRYENPPPGVPADFSRALPEDLASVDFRPSLAVEVVVVTVPALWLLLRLVQRRRRPSSAPPAT